MNSENQTAVGCWWSKAPVQIFERLIRVYKLLVLHFAKESKRYEREASMRNIYSKSSMDFVLCIFFNNFYFIFIHAGADIHKQGFENVARSFTFH